MITISIEENIFFSFYTQKYDEFSLEDYVVTLRIRYSINWCLVNVCKHNSSVPKKEHIIIVIKVYILYAEKVLKIIKIKFSPEMFYDKIVYYEF